VSLISVGPGQLYSTLAAAVSASQDGDTIQIQAGTYVNDFAEVTHKITIQGVGGLAHLEATELIPNGKAILITDTDVTIDRIEFSGARVADQNGAGIRYQGGALTIAHSYFHDNENGILAAADPGGKIDIQSSEFAHNGSGTGFTHNIYVNEIASLTIQDSYIHDAVVGHEVKSRAETTVITGNRIGNGPTGNGSYGIDLPNGGSGLIQGNIIQKGPASQNHVMITFGEEGNVYTHSSLSVTENTIVNQAGASTIAVRNTTGVLASVSGNTVQGLSETQLLLGSGITSDNIFGTGEPPGPPFATPEPSALTLVALGLGVVAVIRRRRRAFPTFVAARITEMATRSLTGWRGWPARYTRNGRGRTRSLLS
jgi:hypothetical protein